MPMITWSDEYLVGVKKIDDQHKELFDKINDLLIAMKEGKGKDEEFKNVLNQLRTTLETKGSSTNLVLEVQKRISEWWRMHILKLDTDLGKYLSEKKS